MQYVKLSNTLHIVYSDAKIGYGVLIEIQLVEGEHDHKLSWPFKQ